MDQFADGVATATLQRRVAGLGPCVTRVADGASLIELRWQMLGCWSYWGRRFYTFVDGPDESVDWQL